MIIIGSVDEASMARYEIERALLEGEQWMVFPPAGEFENPEAVGFDFSLVWGKLIFSCWDQERSLSWRVTAYRIDGAEINLEISCGISRHHNRLTLRDRARWEPSAHDHPRSMDEERRDFLELACALLARRFPRIQIRRSTIEPDRVRAIPGKYARIVLGLDRETILVTGVCDSESQDQIDRVIAAGLVWLSRYNQTRTQDQRARKLWFLLPSTRNQTVIERLSLMDPGRLEAVIECFEVDREGRNLEILSLSTQSELLNAHPRELRWPVKKGLYERWRRPIIELAPGLIEARPNHREDTEVFSIHGLEFARMKREERTRVKFGVSGEPIDGSGISSLTLNESNFDQLESLVRKIMRYRRADSPDRNHPFYRLRTEGWLESLLRRNIHSLDLAFDDRFVYSQVPAWRGDDRAVIDLLTVTRDGRLAVIEIKAAEDIHLPLQGLDYWLRVEQARRRREFELRGFFTGLTLSDQTPLLYLVAPRLRFHRAFDPIAACLGPQIEAFRLGINSNWREGIQVHTRERIN